MGKITDVVTRGKGEAEEANGALLDFSNVTLQSGERVFRASSLDFEAVTGWMAFSGNTASGFRYSTYFAPTTDGTAKLLGLGSFPQISSGGASPTLQAYSSVMTVAGTLEDRAGDATAGAHNLWAKFSADLASATIESGARIAPVWSDIQVNNGDVSAEEVFHFFGSAGGSRARAFLYLEDQQSKYFFESDSALGEAMLASSGYETTQSNDPGGYLKVNLNGTIYGIPLMSAS